MSAFKKIILMVSVIYSSLSMSEEIPVPPHKKWSFEKWNGTFDKGKLQRGFQIYKEVCSTCHSLKRIRFRELSAIGFTALEIKALAASYEIHDGPNDEGEMFNRSGIPSDIIPWVFKNDNQAKSANNGALPPDLSLMVKARKYGASYVYALLTGYAEAPKDLTLTDTQHYNKYFPGHLISMAPPLVSEGQVTYADGTKATIEQMAEDVVTFLAWAAEPELETRKQEGFSTLIFLAFLTILFYFTKRRIWKDVK
jgi:ubiquinol-cytochrome c reductase cytochrome c1 subunit